MSPFWAPESSGAAGGKANEKPQCAPFSVNLRLQRDYSPRTQGGRSLVTECRRNQQQHQAPPGGGGKLEGVHHS
eukprot:1713990-Rhodomonas_salina.1